jgi:hypothetical protein
VLEKIVEGLRVMSSENRFIVKLDKKLQLSFVDNSTASIRNVLIQQYINSDMNIFTKILGQDGMSTS